MLAKISSNIGLPKIYSTALARFATSVTPHHTEDDRLIVHQALLLLNQQVEVLQLIKPEHYTQKVTEIYSSSVGGHIRHILDHYDALVKAEQSAESFANYDERNRDTTIEKDPVAALSSVEHLIQTIPKLNLHKPIEVSFIGHEKTFQAYRVKSSVGREVSFASHHAIHHLSMVKLLLAHFSYKLPENSLLGIALSTAKDMQTRKQN